MKSNREIKVRNSKRTGERKERGRWEEVRTEGG